MSWSASGRADLGGPTLELTYSPPLEQLDEGPKRQAQLATEALEGLLDDGYFGEEGVLSVSMGGHSNPGHALGEGGIANEYLSMSVSRTE